MSGRTGMVRAGLALVGALTAATAAQAALQAWHRAAAPDGSFSIETVCTAAEIDTLRGATGQLTDGVQLSPESRVLCQQPDLIQAAGVINLGDVPAGQSAFDLLAASAKNNPAAGQTQTLTSLDGHRMLLNREVRGKIVAQTGVVEIDSRRLILMISGFQPGTELSASAQAATIDHFTQSLKVAAK